MDPILNKKIQNVKQDLETHKSAYTSNKERTDLKIATVDKELNDFQKTLSQVNINQEAKQKITGYGVVSLPKNAANGQVSVTVMGNTRTNSIPKYSLWDSFSSMFQILDDYKIQIVVNDSSTRYGRVNINVLPNTDYTIHVQHNGEFGISNQDGTVFIVQYTPVQTVTFNTGNNTQIRIYIKNLSNTNGTYYFNYPIMEEGTTVGSFIIGTKSTISAGRLKSVGKNLFDGIISQGSISATTGLDLSANGNYRTQNYIKVEKGQTYSWNLLMPLSEKHVAYYDNNKNFISRETLGATFTPQQDGYVRLRLYNATTPINEESKLIINKGTISLPYEPYTESTQYFTAKDSNGNIVELRSLPNGTKDEVRVSEKKSVKNISDKVILNGSKSWTAPTDLGTVYRVGLPANQIGDNIKDTGGSRAFIDGQELLAYSFYAGDYEHHYIGGSGTLYVYLNKSKIDAQFGETILAKFKAYSNQYPITLTYQLATPIEIPIEVSGTLLSYPSGTVWLENAVADAGMYADKFTILQQDLFIKEIEKISKVDFTTGLETELDVSKAVINTDKKSFTHPSLTANDIVFTTYFYDVESTQGEMTVEYYDSRHVLKDSVTGKFYKVVPTVANGVLSQALVEV